MRAKFINEKFTEDSDPIKDMGIGMRTAISKWMEEIGEEDTDDMALAAAACYGKLDFVKYLVQHGANIHRWADFDSLHMASMNGHLDVVKYLVKNGADINTFVWAIQQANHYGHQDIVQYLESQIKRKSKI